MDIQSTSLGDLLQNIQTVSSEYAIYGPQDKVFSEATQEILVDPDELGDNEDEPKEAQVRGFRYVLLVADVKDIVSNAQSQLEARSMDHLVQAFNFYYDHHAFIRYEK